MMQSQMPPQGRFNKLAVAAAVALVIALLAFAYLGSFIRYMGDDWCTAVSIQEVGLLRAQWGRYVGWTGRFSFTLASGIAHLLGPGVAPLFPALMLALWLISAFWAAYQIALAAWWPRPLFAAMLAAELIVFATLNTSHNIVQSFYWQTGVLTYVAPLVLLTSYIGVLICVARRRSVGRATLPLLALGFVLMFIAGGFSEAYVFMQTGGLSLVAAACFTRALAPFKRSILPPIAVGLAGSVLALLAVALAPGNSVRAGFFPLPTLISFTKISLFYATGHVPYSVYLSPCTTLLALAAPAISAFYLHTRESGRRESFDPRAARRLLILLPVFGYILILLCYVPSAYGMSTYLPGRARIIPQFAFICVTMSFGYLAGAALSKYLTARGHDTSRFLAAGVVVIAALLILSPVSAAWRSLRLVKGARESAFLFDQMDREIRAAKERGVMDQTVTAVDDVETRFGASKTELRIERDPEDWKNKCIAQFYGITSVRAR